MNKLVIFALLVTIAIGQKRIPQIGYLGTGYNGYTGNPFSGGVDPGFLHPVIKLSYSENQITPDGMWLIPDNTTVEDTYSCSYSAITYDAYGSTSYQDSLKENVKGDWSVLAGKFTFGGNSDFQQVTKDMTTFNVRYVIDQVTCQTYFTTACHYCHMTLTDDFLIGVQTLPNSFSLDNTAPWLNFLNTFGTHVAQGLQMGGQLIMTSRFDASSYSYLSQTSEGVDAYAKASFDIFSGNMNGSGSWEKDVEKNFNKKRLSVTQSYVGGAPFVNSSDGGWLEWAKTLAEQPMPISGAYFNLRPVADYLTAEYFPEDPNINDKAQALAVAILSFCQFSPEGCNVAPDPPHQLNIPRASHLLFSPNPTQMVAIGGMGNSRPLSSVEVYNVATNSWTMAAPMFYPRTNFGGGIISNQIFIVGGKNGDLYKNTAEMYNVATNTWTEIPSKMKTARASFAYGVINNEMVVCGGINGQEKVTTCELYDGKTWTVIKQLKSNQLFVGTSGVAVGTVIYGVSNSKLWAFDTASGAIHTFAAPVALPQNPAMSIHHGLVFIAGGVTASGSPSTAVYSFNPASNAFSQSDNLPISLAGAAATEMNGEFVVVGGKNANGLLTSVILYPQ